jgi:hypothetical protein
MLLGSLGGVLSLPEDFDCSLDITDPRDLNDIGMEGDQPLEPSLIFSGIAVRQLRIVKLAVADRDVEQQGDNTFPAVRAMQALVASVSR